MSEENKVTENKEEKVEAKETKATPRKVAVSKPADVETKSVATGMSAAKVTTDADTDYKPEGQIIQEGDKPNLKGKKKDNQIWLDEDIFVEYKHMGSKRSAYRRLYSKNVPLNPSVLDND